VRTAENVERAPNEERHARQHSMRASAVCAVFGLLLPVLSFVTDHAHQHIYVSVL